MIKKLTVPIPINRSIAEIGAVQPQSSNQFKGWLGLKKSGSHPNFCARLRKNWGVTPFFASADDTSVASPRDYAINPRLILMA
jgi:hypothetical protein